MKKYALVLIALALVIQGYSQVSPYSLTPDWYFGVGGRLTFPNGDFPTSTAPTAGSMPTNNSAGVEASTSVSFANGNVAIYTNTQQVYNGNPANASWNDFIRNFVADATCSGSSTGGAIAFPDPVSPTNAFYIVTGNDLTVGSCAGKGMNRYRFTGTGTTVAYNAGPTNMAVSADVGEAITGGTDGEGGYWVVAHDQGTANIFRVWHFTAGGITGPVNYNKNDFFSSANGQSYLKISPCQDKIAFSGGNTLVVYEFDRTTGAVGAELRRVAGSGHGVGLEFSPDGSRVYYSGQGNTVSYVNISTGATGSVAGSASWTMQLGPDGKIYTSGTQGSTVVGVISDPNTTPTYSTIALPGGVSMFRGISNIVWLTPEEPIINSTIDDCTVDFEHEFQNYFLTDIGVNSGTFLWDFDDGGTSTSVAPEHTFAGSGTYDVTLTFKDATCGHTWEATTSVNVSCPAPVTWLDITANQSIEGNKITWSTASEVNNSYFEILRSEDGVNFYPIGNVNGHGTTLAVSHYQFTDGMGTPGTVYYKIVQHDLDGTTSSSKIVSLSREGLQLIIRNNPSNSDFNISIKGSKDHLLLLTDILGRTVYTMNLTEDGSELNFGSELSKGTYILTVVGGDKTISEKLIKQ